LKSTGLVRTRLIHRVAAQILCCASRESLRILALTLNALRTGDDMQVQDEIDLGDGHRIEFGHSTWNPDEISVRNRYPTSTGGFSPRSSSELPIGDVALLAIETLKRGFISKHDAAALIYAATEFLSGNKP
jgi:hypothetical protein